MPITTINCAAIASCPRICAYNPRETSEGEAEVKEVCIVVEERLMMKNEEEE